MRHKIEIIIAGVVDAAGAAIVWASDTSGVWATNYRTGSIVDIGAFTAAIEDGQSVAQSSVTSFALIADDRRSKPGQRAIDIFSRIGAETLTAADVWATTGLAAGDTTLVLAAGTAQTVNPALLHIGTEVVLAATTSIPASGSISITRGQCETLARPHRATGAGYLARTIPVTKYPVEWIGRRVIVKIDGAVWRIGFLTENPSITGNQITFAYVSNENLLSVNRSGDYVPTYGTTLAPIDNEGLYANLDGFNYSRFYYYDPAQSLQFAAGHRNGATKDEILDGEGWELQVGLDADRFIQLWYHFDGDILGQFNLPRAFIHLYNSQDLNSQYDLEIESNSYIAYSQNDYVEFGFTFKPNAEYDAFLNDPLANNWYISTFSISSITTPSPSFAAYPGEHTDTFSYGEFYGEIDILDRFACKLYEDSITFRFLLADSIGGRLNTATHYVGLVSRRNIRPNEVPVSTAQGNLFEGLAPLSDWYNVYSSEFRPCEPDKPDRNESIYPIRPKTQGAVHTQYAKNGCLLTCDMWPQNALQLDQSIGVDMCSAYWELGMQEIFVLAAIPGVGTEDAQVSITWEEPDGENMVATAYVRRFAAKDVSPYLCYKISEVKLDGGAQCVGFGSWRGGHMPCLITRPVSASVRLGNILPQMIASGDGTSGRAFDFLGDGLGCPLSNEGIATLSAVTSGALQNLWWKFNPAITSYSDFLQTAAVVSGKIFVGAVDPTDAATPYGPVARPGGRPMASEAAAFWTDDDIIGQPTSSGEGGLVYTSYRITCGDRVFSIPDWLAADLLGQGQELELDLTDIYSQPQKVTETAVQSIVDQIRDRFGTLRRRWELQVPIDIGLNRCVGDVVGITSKYLIAADGTQGVNLALARIMSISHDFKAGVCSVSLLAWAEYGAGLNLAWDATITAITDTYYYTLQFSYMSADQLVALRRAGLDQTGYKPDGYTATQVFRMFGLKGGQCGWLMTGYFTQWNVTASGGTATFYRSSLTGSTPTTGTDVLITLGASRTSPFSDLFQIGRDRLM